MRKRPPQTILASPNNDRQDAGPTNSRAPYSRRGGGGAPVCHSLGGHAGPIPHDNNRPAGTPVATKARRATAGRPYSSVVWCHCDPVEKRGKQSPRFGDCSVVSLLAMTQDAASHLRVFCGGRGNRFFAKKGFPHALSPSLSRSPA